MGWLRIDLRLDTPLFQGGPNPREVDESRYLRGSAVRGLLRTYARALIGPFVAGDLARTREAERRLFGWAGSESDERAGATFRVADVSDKPLADPRRHRPYPICPHDSEKGMMSGYAPVGVHAPDETPRLGALGIALADPYWNAHRRIEIRPRAASLARFYYEALSAITWAAFSLGSMGKRSRRGYGSLTIVRLEGVPSFAELSPKHRELPIFPDAELTQRELQRRLESGLSCVHSVLKRWLAENGLAQQSERSSDGDFFQAHELLIGKPVRETDPSWGETLLKRIMKKCEAQLGTRRGEYERQLGYAKGRDRLASPLWIRVYRAAGGYVPVATYSPGGRDGRDRDERIAYHILPGSPEPLSLEQFYG